jgi:hypothetical protein
VGALLVPNTTSNDLGYSISYEGIERVIENLDYTNPGILKYKYIQALKSLYNPNEDVMSVQKPDPDDLIRKIWDTSGNLQAVRAKRKNLSSIRSTVNADLKNLFEKGDNPEGITINPDHVFVMSDDAKNERLNAFAETIRSGAGVDLNQITDVLNFIGEFLENNREGLDRNESSTVLNTIQNILDKLDPTRKSEDSLGQNSIVPGGENHWEGVGPDGSSMEYEHEADETGSLVQDEFEEVVDDDVEILEDEILEEPGDVEERHDGREEFDEVDDEDIDILEDEALDETGDDEVGHDGREEFEEVDDEDIDILENEALDEAGDDEVGHDGREEFEEVDDEDVDILEDEALDEAGDDEDGHDGRSEERRVGKECRRLCRSRWSPYH